MLVNTPIAIGAAIFATRLVRESRAHGNTSYDLPGAAFATLGLLSLVYGVSEVATKGWGSVGVIPYLIAAAVLLVGFVLFESKTKNPLLPLRVVTDRTRGGSYLTMLLVAMGMFGMFLFLTFYLQGILHYSALRCGIAFLPFSVGIVLAAGVCSSLMKKFTPRALILTGLVMAIVGLAWFTQISPHAHYLLHVLPGELIMSFGLGLVFVPASNTALRGVGSHDAGVASATLNTAQQVGGSIGTALLNTLAASATASYITAHGHIASSAATVKGYTFAFWVSTSFLFAALVVVAATIQAPKTDPNLPQEAFALA